MIGKGMFIWKGKHISPNPRSVVDKCVELGLSWVVIKLGDGSSTRYAAFERMDEAVDLFHCEQIKVWGYSYVTGGNGRSSLGPRQDAEFAVSQSLHLGLDGYLIDAEAEYKSGSNPKARARLFADVLQALACQMPVGLCSYRFPSLHPSFPWREFLSVATLHVPQVYWGPGRSIIDLNRSMRELTALKSLPVIPVGRAYIGNGYPVPGPGYTELSEWMTTVKTLGLKGFLLWGLDFLCIHKGGDERFMAIRDYRWGDLVTV